jgi:Zn-dependent M28 family amino/carboxypeptidase
MPAMRTLPLLALVILPLAPVKPLWAGSFTAREKAVIGRITEPAIRARVRFLAHDLLEGRAPGTRGSELAMAYVASELERMGLTPAGDGGTYFQRFPIVGMRAHPDGSPTAHGPGGTVTLQPSTDLIVSSGLQAPAARVDAEVVFAGYGITAPEQRWDDFKDVDVRGKVLLVMNNDPESDPSLFGGKTRLYYGRWTYKYEEAARRGAAAVIIIHTTPSAGYPWQVVQASWEGRLLELPARPGEPRVAVKMWATEPAARKLAALGGKDLDRLREAAERRDFRPVPLGVRMQVAVRTELERLETANVLGRLNGVDPVHAQELVVLSAHHDHLGIRAEKGGDAIYNGALDNASGVAAVLTAAEALVQARPKRSILFAALAAEESGLLGSEYLCAHPPVPAGSLAAVLNVDGINIWGRTRDVREVGLGKSTLDDVVRTVGALQGRVLAPDPFPDRGHFYRSDQLNFARIGVPALYLASGIDFLGHDPAWGRQRKEEYERERYHQPSDQLDERWILTGAVEDLQLLTVVGLRVADAASMPAWVHGDEFEATRQRALAGAAGTPPAPSPSDR